jgi:hypothetical protein
LPIDPDLSRLLSDIRDNLKLEGKSNSQLVSEVRDAIRGTSEPTVATGIRDLKKTLTDEFAQLRDTMRIAGGIPGGAAAAGTRAGGPKTQFETEELGLTSEIVKALKAMQVELSAMTEVLGQHGGTGGGAGASGFDVKVLQSRYNAIDRILGDASKSFTSKLGSLSNEFFDKGGMLTQQYNLQQKRATEGLLGMASKTFDLIGVFERLGTFIKTQIVERYAGFMSNRAGGLSGSEYMFDDIKRILDTLKGTRDQVGYGLVDTKNSIQKALGSGMTSPNILYGQGIDKLSQSYRQMIEDMEKRGANPRSFGSPDQLEQLFNVLTERQKGAGPFEQMRQNEALQIQSNSVKFLSDIAKATNVSADKLIELVKAATEEATEQAALGNLKPQEVSAFTEMTALLKSSYGPTGSFMAQQMSKFIGAERDPAMFMRNNPDAAAMNAMTGGKALEMLSRVTDLSLRSGNAAEKMTQLQQIMSQYQGIGQLPSGLRGSIGVENKLFGQYGAAAAMLGGNAPGAPPIRGGPDAVENVMTGIEDLTKRFPMFSSAVGSFVGGVGSFVSNLAILYGASRMLGIGAGAAGAGGSVMGGVGRALGGAARLAGPLLGGVGAAAGAYMEGAPAAGVVGAGVGGGLGAWGGAALGASIGTAIAPVVGTAIGGILGGIVGAFGGGWAGQKVGTAIGGPAVGAPNENMVGPGGQMVTGSAMADPSSVGLLAQIATGGSQSVGILGAIHAELARQTTLLGGAGGSVPAYNGSGLTSMTAPVAKTGRADASTAYSGTGG